MTAFAGVNLRVEDIPHFKAACQQAGLDPTSIPVLGILHDDDDHLLADSLRQFAGLHMRAYRCPSPNSQLVLRPADGGGLPIGAHVIAWNEADESQGWWDLWWKQARAQRPDLVLHYGAPNVNNQWPLNTALLAQLDVEDAHIGSTFAPPPAHGKPVWVTEIDIDPARFTITGGPYPWGSPTDMAAAYSELLDCMRRCVAAGIPVFGWGIQGYAPDVAYDATALAAIAHLNHESTPAPVPAPTQGGAPMADEPTQDAQIASEMTRETYLAEAAYAMAKMLDKLPTNMIDPALQQEYHTFINALDPAKFSF